MHDREDPDAPPPLPAWLITYAELMTLLLAFFVMLCSMAQWNARDARYDALLDSLGRRFGRQAARSDETETRSSADSARLAALSDRMSQGRGQRDVWLKGAAVFPFDEESAEPVQVRPLWSGSLPTDSAGLSPEQIEDLTALARQGRGMTGQIEIVGYVDPLSGAADADFNQRWDRAEKRCRKVLSCLVDQGGLPPGRILVTVRTRPENPLGGPEPSRSGQFELFFRTANPASGGPAANSNLGLSEGARRR